MMFWYGDGFGGWAWFAMSVGMVLFWALVIVGAVLLFRALERPGEHVHTPAVPSPEQLLAERFARGEIDEEEYRSRLAALRAAGPSGRP
ncbi:MAG TPA: SHOCT domain-containing protein [Streptomyces sp.]|nr:SHOCT domain-containing protein [Streptomyces sp.]